MATGRTAVLQCQSRLRAVLAHQRHLAMPAQLAIASWSLIALVAIAVTVRNMSKQCMSTSDRFALIMVERI